MLKRKASRAGRNPQQGTQVPGRLRSGHPYLVAMGIAALVAAVLAFCTHAWMKAGAISAGGAVALSGSAQRSPAAESETGSGADLSGSLRSDLLGIFLVAALLGGGVVALVGWESARQRKMARAMAERERRLQAQLESATAELRQKNLLLAFQNEKVMEINRLKSAFLANVSHELRTPLNAIIALSEMLRDELSGPLNEEQKRQASMIFQSGSKLLDLINQVLDLSKIEAGKLEVKRRPAFVIEELRDAVEALRPLAASKGLALEFHGEGGGVEVLADTGKLRQVVTNLVGNAIKFTETGGVSVRAVLDARRSKLTVQVEDTGPGIPPEHQRHIFDEFEQVDGSSTRRHGGTGLGLAISQKLVVLMGGEIWVESEPGKGARFAFVVPVALADGSGERGEAEAGVLGQRRRALFVAADQDEVELLARLLRSDGIEATPVAGVLGSVGSPECEGFDVVILRPAKEVASAVEFIEKLRQDPGGSRLPVVVSVPGDLDPESRGLLEAAADCVVAHGPGEVSKLASRVHDLLGAPSREQEGSDGVGRPGDRAA